MPTYVPTSPSQKIRIRRQRGWNTWSAICRGCWYNGVNAELCMALDMATFEKARNWAVGHIAIEHRQDH